ncbi:MAG TPA: hypothetical protein VGT03_08975 [Candidatus Acidoferrales bacterium]|nr:hypothetical protein [Candidatus Acidoferrales bacterium]
MSRRSVIPSVVLFLSFLMAAPTFAQRRPPLPVPPAPKGTAGQPGKIGANRGAHAQQPSCQQQAGVTKATMEQLQAINMQTRSQVEAVCSNSSLDEKQKMQEIRQIRQGAQAQRDGLLSPEQRQAIQECQRARQGAHPPAPHVGIPHPPTGPCGEPLPQGKPSVPPQPSGTGSE